MSGPDASFDDDPQLRERLRAVDPAASLAPADPDRVARLLEATMSTPDRDTTHDTGQHDIGQHDTTQHRDTGTTRRPFARIAGVAAVLVIGGVAFAATTGGDDETPPTAGGDPAPSVLTLAAPAEQGAGARCMMPNADVLAGQDVAFLGTVEELGADTVLLAVDEQYAGEEADEVRVESPADRMELLVGSVDFREGEQYLVSATGGEVAVCGLSGPATGELQNLYAEAFGG
ncbi:hypothetical protein [Nocardioides abyssi]|uniref:DUF5666 domain-containing protein n=1 Tax=Nocardioides abyssi TaxID=3058370 RepID=A0ABT8EWL8_9ACTN|nr:hypothetical protein [Nocardioides abyssi]MDN4162583.1 hypothetical protein [Nocardioides abyssi]